jgi:hypothetical protein
MLHRNCRKAGCEQEVALLATSPLTDEAWTSLTGLHVLAGGLEMTRPAMFSPEEIFA